MTRLYAIEPDGTRTLLWEGENMPEFVLEDAELRCTQPVYRTRITGLDAPPEYAEREARERELAADVEARLAEEAKHAIRTRGTLTREQRNALASELGLGDLGRSPRRRR